MNILLNKSLTFAKKILCEWKDTGGNDCKAYQRRYSYVHASGAYDTAKSYWILHESKYFSDCNTLARNLLERIISSLLGVKSPTHAVELIAYELSEKIRREKLWTPSPNISAQLHQTIKEEEKFLQTFLGLIGKLKAPDWDYKKRFDDAGVPGLYRSLYFKFSRYAHAGYEVPRPERRNQQPKEADFIALVAPVMTAANCHAVDCPDCNQGKCGLRAKSLELLQAFKSCTLGNKGRASGKQRRQT